MDAPDDALRLIVDFVAAATGAASAAIVLKGEDGVEVTAARRADGWSAMDGRDLPADPLVARVLSGDGAAPGTDAGASGARPPAALRERSGAGSVLCVPIAGGSRVFGALHLVRARGRFGDRLVADLTMLASLAVPFLVQLRRAAGRTDAAADQLIGESPGMVEVRRLIARVAPTDLAVLVRGPTGTGKELTARAIHAASRRSDRPMVTVDCSAVAEGLLEAELFGFRKGAFTGAVADREGRVEAANGSTLFLDEVGDMAVGMQAALLRGLQEKEVTRVGENLPRPVDFRVIAATNKDLDAEVAAGRFREDLLFRLREITIELPPLSARGDDVPLLARLFVRQCERRLGLAAHSITPAAERALAEHAWPGNVRELSAVMRRAVVLCDDLAIDIDDLALPTPGGAVAAAPRGPPSTVPAPAVAPRDAGPGDVGRPLAEARRAWVSRYVRAAIERSGGDRADAAAALGISLRSLYRYL